MAQTAAAIGFVPIDFSQADPVKAFQEQQRKFLKESPNVNGIAQ